MNNKTKQYKKLLKFWLNLDKFIALEMPHTNFPLKNFSIASLHLVIPPTLQSKMVEQKYLCIPKTNKNSR